MTEQPEFTNDELFLYELKARAAGAISPEELLEVRVQEIRYLLTIFDNQVLNIELGKYQGARDGYDHAINATADTLLGNRPAEEKPGIENYRAAMLARNPYTAPAAAIEQIMMEG